MDVAVVSSQSSQDVIATLCPKGMLEEKTRGDNKKSLAENVVSIKGISSQLSPCGFFQLLDEDQLAVFRTQICSAVQSGGKCHSEDRCLYSHCIAWQRRNPYKSPYWAELCPDISFAKKSEKMTLINNCLHKRKCLYAHSKEEQLYHPSTYKIKMCVSYPHCKRSLCPFAHDVSEVRNKEVLKERIESALPRQQPILDTQQCTLNQFSAMNSQHHISNNSTHSSAVLKSLGASGSHFFLPPVGSPCTPPPSFGSYPSAPLILPMNPYLAGRHVPVPMSLLEENEKLIYPTSLSSTAPVASLGTISPHPNVSAMANVSSMVNVSSVNASSSAHVSSANNANNPGHLEKLHQIINNMSPSAESANSIMQQVSSLLVRSKILEQNSSSRALTNRVSDETTLPSLSHSTSNNFDSLSPSHSSFLQAEERQSKTTLESINLAEKSLDWKETAQLILSALFVLLNETPGGSYNSSALEHQESLEELRKFLTKNSKTPSKNIFDDKERDLLKETSGDDSRLGDHRFSLESLESPRKHRSAQEDKHYLASPPCFTPKRVPNDSCFFFLESQEADCKYVKNAREDSRFLYANSRPMGDGNLTAWNDFTGKQDENLMMKPMNIFDASNNYDNCFSLAQTNDRLGDGKRYFGSQSCPRLYSTEVASTSLLTPLLNSPPFPMNSLSINNTSTAPSPSPPSPSPSPPSPSPSPSTSAIPSTPSPNLPPFSPLPYISTLPFSNTPSYTQSSGCRIPPNDMQPISSQRKNSSNDGYSDSFRQSPRGEPGHLESNPLLSTSPLPSPLLSAQSNPGFSSHAFHQHIHTTDVPPSFSHNPSHNSCEATSKNHYTTSPPLVSHSNFLPFHSLVNFLDSSSQGFVVQEAMEGNSRGCGNGGMVLSGRKLSGTLNNLSSLSHSSSIAMSSPLPLSSPGSRPGALGMFEQESSFPGIIRDMEHLEEGDRRGRERRGEDRRGERGERREERDLREEKGRRNKRDGKEDKIPEDNIIFSTPSQGCLSSPNLLHNSSQEYHSIHNVDTNHSYLPSDYYHSPFVPSDLALHSKFPPSSPSFHGSHMRQDFYDSSNGFIKQDNLMRSKFTFTDSFNYHRDEPHFPFEMPKTNFSPYPNFS